MQKLDNISEDLFKKLRSRFPNLTIGDESGTVTNNPKEARFFDFAYTNDGTPIGKVSVSIDENEGLVVLYSNDIVEYQDDISKKNWFDFLKELRVFSKKRMLDFSVRDINKSNLTKKDYNFLATNRTGDGKMNESKLYGTSRISYQNVGEARIMIKHTESVDQESATARTRNIGRIYIESPEGERFKYPFKHLSGARALARHVAEGGNAYDDFGKHIVGLSEEMAKLRKFKNYMGRSSVMAESLSGYLDIVKERITTVKKTIESLQKPAYYKQTFEAFETPVLEDVPNDVAENWIDELTIRQFNEELQDIFPYIYNLVKEGTQAKELGPHDLLGESDEQLDEIAPAAILLGTAIRAAVPALTRIGANIIAKGGNVAAKGAGAVAKGAGTMAVKHPIATTVAGGAAYAGKKAGDAIDAVGDMATDLKGDADALIAQASSGIEAIQDQVTAAIGNSGFLKVANFASKYALPGLAVVALLYGGKKVIDMLSDKADDVEKENIEIDEAVEEGWKTDAALGALGGAFIMAMAVPGVVPASAALATKLAALKSYAGAGALGGSIGATIGGALKRKDQKKKSKEEFELEQAFEDTMGQFADAVCEECGNQSWRTLDEEKQKGVDGKVCWKGYKRMGTKKKGGKTVDNCVKVKEDDLEEAYINTSKDAVEVLGTLRGMGKKIERGQDDDQGNLANQYVSDVWDVYSFIEARTNGFSGLDKGAKAAIDAMMKLRGEAKKLETKPGSGKNARFGNAIVNTLYPVIEYLYTTDFDRNKKEDDTEEGNAYSGAVAQAKKDGKKKGDKVKGPDGAEITLEKDTKTPLGEFILSYYDREAGEFPKGETAVLTMVEKDYGEQFIEPAKAFIEQVQALFDEYQMATQPQQMGVESGLERLRDLAGVR